MRTRLLPAICAIALGALSGSAALANPGGAQVVHGQVGFAQPNFNTLNITNSPGAIINWQKFSIQNGQTTRFIQNSAASAILNRVTGANPSALLGRLLSNGRVFLINRNGIVFGPNAVIDTAGLVASTLNITDQDFISQNLKFQGDSQSGSIENQGYIKAGANGNIFLIAPNIKNSGIIETDGGQLVLAAGQRVTLASLDSDDIVFEVQAPDNEVVNLGTLLTRGGAAGMFAGTIKHSGSINADSISVDARGRIQLLAKSQVRLEKDSIITASGETGGSIEIEAKSVVSEAGVTANGVAGAGGDIQIRGSDWVSLGNTVDASGVSGGRIEIKTGGLSLAAPLSATGTTGAGGKVTIHTALKSTENSAAVIDVSGAGGGSITHIAEQQITSSATYRAVGSKGRGGQIDISAPATKLLSATLDATGASGGGRVRVGGEYQGGKDLAVDDLPNAALLAVSSGTTVRADAGGSGAGGTVILWADEKAVVYADISARPGDDHEAGGFIEISSANTLTFGGKADAGAGGNVLFDPKNIVIANAAAGNAPSQLPLVLGFNYTNIPSLNSSSNLETDDQFGTSVSLNGNRLAVGARTDDGTGAAAPNAGAVYLFSFADSAFNSPVLEATLGKGYSGGKNFDPSGLEFSDLFGSSVSLDGNRLAVGATGDDGSGIPATSSSTGAVYLFSFADSVFTTPVLEATIGKGYDPVATGNAKDFDLSALEVSDFFGASVSLNGNRLAVGSQFDGGSGNAVVNSGAVYLFSFADNVFTTPTLEATIGKGYNPFGPGNLKDFDLSILESADAFGTSVSVDGNRLAVGAAGDDASGNAIPCSLTFPCVGAVYLFSFADSVFTTPTLEATIGKGYSPFGPGNLKDFDLGALEDVDGFGSSVALNGNRLAVGATQDDGPGNATIDSGAVYLFSFADNVFTTPTLEATIGKGYNPFGPSNLKDFNLNALEAGDTFGTSVSLDGNRLAVGAKQDDGIGNAFSGTGNTGAVYLFSFADSLFSTPLAEATYGKGYSGAKDFGFIGLEANDAFATSVSLDGNRLAVGANQDDGFGTTGPFDIAPDRTGAVYLFSFADSAFSSPKLEATIGKGYKGGKNFDLSALDAVDFFGASASLNGNRLAVGAIGDDGFGPSVGSTGAVYLFSFADAVFTSPVLEAIIGKGYDPVATGNAKDFDLGALELSDSFGSSVSLNGNRLAVGAPGDDDLGNTVANSGTVYLFSFADSAFTTPLLEATIGKGYDPIATGNAKDFDVTALAGGDNFGSSVSVDGNRLAVGAELDDGLAPFTSTDAGAVYLFSFADSAFSTPKLESTIGRGYKPATTGNAKDLDLILTIDGFDHFGTSVSLDGNLLAVGAPFDDGLGNALATNSNGAVHLFSFADNVFTAPVRDATIGGGYINGNDLDLTTLEYSDRFGDSVSLNSNRLVAGAPGDDGLSNAVTDSGAVYFFSIISALGDDPLTAQFGTSPAADFTITPAALVNLLDNPQNVILQANNDITVTDSILVAAGGAGGDLTFQAGRSVLFNADVTTDNGDLLVFANDAGAVDAQRDAGAAQIVMAASTTLDTGSGNLTLEIGTGPATNNSNGDIVLANLKAAHIQITNNGPSANSDILRTAINTPTDPLITADSLFIDHDPSGSPSGGSVGTAAAPLRIAVSNLAAHTHAASPGIFFDSVNTGVTTIGDTFFGDLHGIRGLETVAGGDIVVNAAAGITVLQDIRLAGSALTLNAGTTLPGDLVFDAEAAFNDPDSDSTIEVFIGSSAANTGNATLSGDRVKFLGADTDPGTSTIDLRLRGSGTLDINATSGDLIVEAGSGGPAGPDIINIVSGDLSAAPGAGGQMNLTASNDLIADSPAAGGQQLQALIQATNGNLILNTGNDFSLDAGPAAASIVNLNVSGDLNATIAGTAVLTAGSGNNADVDLTAGSISLFNVGGAMTIQAGGNTSADIDVISNGAFNLMTGTNLDVTAMASDFADARLSANGPFAITVGGDFNITGGNGNESDANVKSFSGGSLTATISGALNMIANNGLNADVELEADGLLKVVTGTGLTIQGGGATGAFSEIVSQSNTVDASVTGPASLSAGAGTRAEANIIGDSVILNISGGGLTMTGGGGQDAETEIASNTGPITLNSAGSVILQGGTGNASVVDGDDGSQAQIDANTNLNLTTGADLRLLAGTGLDADADIKTNTGTATVNVTGLVDVKGNGVEADAEITSESDLNLTTGGDLNLISGAGSNSDSTVETKSGAVTASVGAALNMIPGNGSGADVEFEADTSFILDVGTTMTLDAIGGGSNAFVFLGMTNSDIATLPSVPLTVTTGGNLFLRGGAQSGTAIDMQGGITTLDIGGNLDLLAGSGSSTSVEIDQASVFNIDIAGALTMAGGPLADTAALIGENNAGATVTIGKNAPIGGAITLTGGTHLEGLAAIGTTCMTGPCPATVTINGGTAITLNSNTGEAFIGSLTQDSGPVMVKAGQLGPGNLFLGNGHLLTDGPINLINSATGGQILDAGSQVDAGSGSIIASANGAIQIPQASASLFQFTSSSGGINLTQAISTPGTVIINAGTGNFDMSAPGQIIAGSDISISGNDLFLNATGITDLTSPTQVTLNATGQVSNFGATGGTPDIAAPVLNITSQSGVELDIDVTDLSINNSISGSVIIIDTGTALSANSVLNPGRPVSIDTQLGPLAIGAVNGSVVTLMPGTSSGTRAITDANGGAANITAATLVFSAADGFGSFADPLETQVANAFSVDTSMGDIGIVQSGNLNLSGNLNTSGSIRLGASGGTLLVQDQSITSSAGSIDLSAGNITIQAISNDADVTATRGALNVTTAGTLSVLGSNVSASTTAKLTAGTTLNINAGQVLIKAGSAANADASIDPTVLNMNVSGDLDILAGAGDFSDAELAAGSLFLNIDGNTTLMAGAGNQAHATINAFSGDVAITSVINQALLNAAPPGATLLPGSVALFPGTGANADAVIFANSGSGLVTIKAGNCINCTVLGADPFLDPASQAGIFGFLNFTPLNPVLVPAATPVPTPDTNLPDVTDQVLVTDANSMLALLLLPGELDEGGEDEGSRVLMCR